MWPYVSNMEAIAVNQQWVGDPGRLLNLTDGQALHAGVEVWAKLQPHQTLALLAINTAASDYSPKLSINLSHAWPNALPPMGWCSDTKACVIRDIWRQETIGESTDWMWHIQSLAPHDSAFVLISQQHRI